MVSMMIHNIKRSPQQPPQITNQPCIGQRYLIIINLSCHHDTSSVCKMSDAEIVTSSASELSKVSHSKLSYGLHYFARSHTLATNHVDARCHVLPRCHVLAWCLCLHGVVKPVVVGWQKALPGEVLQIVKWS